MKSYIIHLVRHGITEANMQGRYAGTTDVDLSSEGIKQLKELKEKYDYENPEIIYSSPLTRCIDTADILYGRDREIKLVNDLHEINLGDFEGKLVSELTTNEDYTNWARYGTKPPNGESNSEFATRICTAFVRTIRDILKSGKTTAAICTHGGVIMMLLSVYGIPQRESIDWMCSNGRGFTIRVTPSVWMRTGMVEVLSEYPFGSSEEQATIDSDMKKDVSNAMTSGIEDMKKPTNDDLDDDFDEFDDEFDDGDEPQNDVIWADVDESVNNSSENE